MNAIKFETAIDEIVAGPARGTLDAFLARRLKRPDGLPPVSLAEMERAIAQGAGDHA